MQNVMRDVEDSTLLEEGLDFASAKYRRRVRAPISRSKYVPKSSSGSFVNTLVNKYQAWKELLQGKRKWPGLWEFSKMTFINRWKTEAEALEWATKKFGNALASKIAYPMAGRALRELDAASFRNDIERILAEEDN